MAKLDTLKKEVGMADRIIERELTHRVVELTIKGKEIILIGKETIKRGNGEMTIELSEKLTGKKKKAIKGLIKELQKKFRSRKSSSLAGGILFETCPKCGGIVTLQGRGILQKACSRCKTAYHPQVFG